MTARARRCSRYTELPDAAAIGARVCAAHRRGLTGRGVRVALVDSGIDGGSWFVERAFRLVPSPHRTARGDASHGTALAAVVFSVAPDVRLEEIVLGAAPQRALHLAARSGADLVLAAWGTAAPATDLDGFDASTCITVRHPERTEWPASLGGANAVAADTLWPTGPFSCAAVPEPFAGLSVAAAIATGVAALLICDGVDPREAAALAVGRGGSWPPCPPPLSFDYEAT